ncbi:MAG: lipoprotein insertase outer membrane protein LolB [Aestuariibacter sp.]
MAFKSPEESFSATLHWRHNQNSSHMRLSKLLGGTLFTLDMDQTGATLVLDGNTYHDDNAQRMIYQLTGWLIPIAQLQQWVQGLSGPESRYKSIEKHPSGTLLKLQSNNGWQVSYQNYQTVGTLSLPENLSIKRNGLRIKLRINDWYI